MGHSSLAVPLPSVSHPSGGVTVKQSDNTFLVIAPLWPHQSWYPHLISLSMDHPLCLPQREDLQDLPKRFGIHPNPGLFHYHAWLLSGSTSKQQAFRRALWTELPCLRETPQDASTMPSGREFCRWYLRRKADPVSADVPLVAEFLEHLVPENFPFGYRYY